MARFRCTVKRVIIYEKEIIVKAEDEDTAADLADQKAGADLAGSWGAPIDDTFDCDSVEELTDDPDDDDEEDEDDDEEDEDDDDDEEDEDDDDSE